MGSQGTPFLVSHTIPLADLGVSMANYQLAQFAGFGVLIRLPGCTTSHMKKYFIGRQRTVREPL